MHYAIKDALLLKKILWVDALLGGATAALGLLFSPSLARGLGVEPTFVLVVAGINLLYALVAFTLVRQAPVSVPLLRLLVNANWTWTGISVVLLLVHVATATVLGKAVLVLQIPVVGGLAFIEGRQLIKTPLSTL